MRDQPTGPDALDEKSPAMDGKPGVTVGHEDIRLSFTLVVWSSRDWLVALDRCRATVSADMPT
jgi:hypothetical protein